MQWSKPFLEKNCTKLMHYANNARNQSPHTLRRMGGGGWGEEDGGRRMGEEDGEGG